MRTIKFDENGNIVSVQYESLEIEKEDLKQLVKEKRQLKNSQDYLILNTYLLNIDSESVSSLVSVLTIASISPDQNIDLKCKNGFFTITVEQLKQIISEINSIWQSNFSKEKDAVDMISSAENVESLYSLVDAYCNEWN